MYNIMVEYLLHCKMITMVSLVYYLSLYIINFSLIMKAFKIYYFSNFQIYNIANYRHHVICNIPMMSLFHVHLDPPQLISPNSNLLPLFSIFHNHQSVLSISELIFMSSFFLIYQFSVICSWLTCNDQWCLLYSPPPFPIY